MVHWQKSVLTMAGIAMFCFAVPSGTMAAEKSKGKESEQTGVSCVAPAKGPLAGAKTQESGPTPPATASEVRARVGHPAPDFEANALVKGGFKNLKLSDYKGKWVVLCFYPGDFTFV